MNVESQSDLYADAFLKHRTSDELRVEKWASRILTEGAIIPSDILLDLGCGVGRFTHRLAGSVYRVYGYDSNPRMIALAEAKKSNVKWINANFLQQDLPAVTVILMSMVLEHLEDQEAAIVKSAASLATGGRLVIRTMLPPDLLNTTWYQFVPKALEKELSRTPTLPAIRESGAKAGLDVICIAHYTDKVSPEVAKQLPQRLREKSFEILHHLDDTAIIRGMQASTEYLSREGPTETMAASLVVLSRK